MGNVCATPRVMWDKNADSTLVATQPVGHAQAQPLIVSQTYANQMHVCPTVQEKIVAVMDVAVAAEHVPDKIFVIPMGNVFANHYAVVLSAEATDAAVPAEWAAPQTKPVKMVNVSVFRIAQVRRAPVVQMVVVEVVAPARSATVVAMVSANVTVPVQQRNAAIRTHSSPYLVNRCLHARVIAVGAKTRSVEPTVNVNVLTQLRLLYATENVARSVASPAEVAVFSSPATPSTNVYCPSLSVPSFNQRLKNRSNEQWIGGEYVQRQPYYLVSA